MTLHQPNDDGTYPEVPGDPTGDQLLRAWYNWWVLTEDVPVKMPDALHVRTAVYLLTKDMPPERHTDE